MDNTIDIYRYTDFKKYLKEFRDFRKAEDPGFSNTYICYVLGQKNSNSYFNNVLSGRIKIGPTIIQRFQTLLHLSKEEFSYFRNMVSYSQAKEFDDKEHFFKQMMKTNRIKGAAVSAEFQEYYGEWYHPVVRALFDIIDYNGDNMDDLHKPVKQILTLKQLKSSVELLLRLKLLQKNAEGFYKPANAIISNGGDIEESVLKLYQQKVLQFGFTNLQNDELSPQKTTTMTLSLSEEGFQQIEQRVAELRQEVRAIAQNDSEQSENLYQISIHLYPFTKVLKWKTC